MPTSPSISTELRPYIPIADFLSAVLGDDTEVVLHDVRDPEHSISYIVGTNLSERKVGGPMTDLALQILNTERLSGRDFLTNYSSRASTGVIFKSHTYFIRDTTGRIMGMICINTDIRRVIQARELLDSLARVHGLSSVESADSVTEELGTSSADLVTSSIDKRITESGLDPALMSAEDKKRVVSTLEEDGVFLLRGAVAEAAVAFHVSEATIYRYIRAAKRGQ